MYGGRSHALKKRFRTPYLGRAYTTLVVLVLINIVPFKDTFKLKPLYSLYVYVYNANNAINLLKIQQARRTFK